MGCCQKELPKWPPALSRELLEETGLTLTEHDDAAWADPRGLPAVSDETRALLAG